MKKAGEIVRHERNEQRVIGRLARGTDAIIARRKRSDSLIETADFSSGTAVKIIRFIVQLEDRRFVTSNSYVTVEILVFEVPME